MKKHLFGGILWLIVIPIVGYLLCSLFSWNFYVSEWNKFSNVIAWIFGAIEVITLKDVISIAFEKDK